MDSNDAPSVVLAIIIDRLGDIAAIRGAMQDSTPADQKRIALYAQRLAWVPGEALERAFTRIESADERGFPSLGAILAQARDCCEEAGYIERGDEAWKRAVREAGRWHPQTRPLVTFANPATERTVERLGGDGALRNLDEKGIQITRQRFLAFYAEECITPEHFMFITANGGYLKPLPPIKGIELPSVERERIQAAAQRLALPVPAYALLEEGKE